MWLRSAGVEDADTTRGLRFIQSDVALQAAAEGLGVVLGRLFLAADDIAAGRLVCPFSNYVMLELAYYLVGPEAAFSGKKSTAFRKWLVTEIEASRKILNSLSVLPRK